MCHLHNHHKKIFYQQLFALFYKKICYVFAKGSSGSGNVLKNDFDGTHTCLTRFLYLLFWVSIKSGSTPKCQKKELRYDVNKLLTLHDN